MSRKTDSAVSMRVSMPTSLVGALPLRFSIESSLRSMSFSRYCNSDLADDVRHVSMAVNAIPPINKDNGRSVPSLMMLVPDCDATPTPASAMPDDVHMNCDMLSIELCIIKAILLVRINLTLLFVLTTATGIDIHLADCTLRMTMHFDEPQWLSAEWTAWLCVIHHHHPIQ